MIDRKATSLVLKQASHYKVLALVGARQVGKTTLAKTLFGDKPYVSLENPDQQAFAIEDPRGFLASYQDGAVIDEAQRVPSLFAYLQEVVDNSQQKGLFILSGSNNFLLNQAISQSLAGRVAYVRLPTFTLSEISDLLPDHDDQIMLKGFYPPVYDQEIPAVDWYKNYIQTYIERDVRQISNITNLTLFSRLLSLLAGRTGQELNFTSLSNEVGVDTKTIQSWIGILEASFLIYLLKPYHQNFNKTIIKRPKIYLTDVGLACSLLRITSDTQLENHPLRGALFETMIVMEFIKQAQNTGRHQHFFYWRDKSGREVDLLTEEAGQVTPMEIKSAKTIHQDFFKNLTYWNQLSQNTKGVLLYAGDDNRKRSDGLMAQNWRKYLLEEVG